MDLTTAAAGASVAFIAVALQGEKKKNKMVAKTFFK